jgi:hypothetical protein
MRSLCFHHNEVSTIRVSGWGKARTQGKQAGWSRYLMIPSAYADGTDLLQRGIQVGPNGEKVEEA